MLNKSPSQKKLEKILTKDFVRIDYLGIDGEIDFEFGKISDFFKEGKNFYLKFSHKIKYQQNSFEIEKVSYENYLVIKDFKNILSGTEEKIKKEFKKNIEKIKERAENNYFWGETKDEKRKLYLYDGTGMGYLINF